MGNVVKTSTKMNRIFSFDIPTARYSAPLKNNKQQQQCLEGKACSAPRYRIFSLIIHK